MRRLAAALVLSCRRSDALLTSPSHRLQSTLLFADAVLPESSRSPRDRQQTRAQKRRSSQTFSRSTELERPEILYSNNHVCVVNKPAGRRTEGRSVACHVCHHSPIISRMEVATRERSRRRRRRTKNRRPEVSPVLFEVPVGGRGV